MIELKTLKNIGFNELWEAIKSWDIGKFYPKRNDGLLTSKEDILYAYANGDDVRFILDVVRIIQRQEAIKWGKIMHEELKTQPDFDKERLELGSHRSEELGEFEGYDALDFIMYFFNITEDDLK